MSSESHAFVWTTVLEERHAELSDAFMTRNMSDAEWALMKLLEHLGDQQSGFPQITEDALVEYCRGAIERETGSDFSEPHWRQQARAAIEACKAL